VCSPGIGAGAPPAVGSAGPRLSGRPGLPPGGMGGSCCFKMGGAIPSGGDAFSKGGDVKPRHKGKSHK
jgi:hypothetical protein